MRWDDVRHQDAALSRLDRAMRGGRLAHALLFAGPEGVGKGMTALRLAQRLLCNGRELEACGRCDDCRAVESGTHLDLQIVERTMNRFHPNPEVRRRQANDLGVDVIRRFLIEPASRHPVRGRAKVFIVEEAERMSPAAENALLKTLEEPPGASYLILLATSEDRLLPTTRSRCQVVRFGRLPDEFVRRHLMQQVEVPDEDAAYLVGLADGRPGVALQYAAAGLVQHRDRVLELIGGVGNDPLAFGKAMQDLVKVLAAGPAAESEAEDEPDAAQEDEEASAEQQAGDARALRAGRRLALTLVGTALRDILRASLGQTAVAHPGARAIQALASRWTAAGAAQAIEAIAEAETHVERSAYPPLIFDVLGIRLARAAAVRRVA